jgi:phospholipase C
LGASGIQNGRCGYGPRQPFLVISPYAKKNYVDHRVTDQSSILRFIEDNWGLGRIGNGSTDAIAGSINGMLDLDDHDGSHHDRDSRLILDPATGRIIDGDLD